MHRCCAWHYPACAEKSHSIYLRFIRRVALPRVRGEEHGKVSVKLYQHALGQAAAPAQTMVPAARSRAEWMDKLRPFELVRRQTQH